LAQKPYDEKRGTLFHEQETYPSKCKRFKRHPMKKEASHLINKKHTPQNTMGSKYL
jgi:hypothetical protein